MNLLSLSWQVIRFDRWRYLLTIALWTIVHNLPLLPGIIILYFFNALLGNAPFNILLGILFLFLLAPVFRALIVLLVTSTSVTFRYTIDALLMKNLIERILELPGAQALPASRGEAVSRFRDDTQIIERFVSMIANVIGRIIFTIVALIIMIHISLLITLVVIAPLIVMMVLTQILSRKLKAYRAIRRQATGSVTGFLGEIFGAVQVVKVANAETHAANHFQKLNDMRRGASIKETVFNASVTSVFSNMIDVGTGLILLLASASIRSHAFTVGDFAFFAYNLDWITETPLVIGGLLAQYKQAEVSLHQLMTLLQGARQETLSKPGPIYLGKELAPVPYVERTPDDILNTLEVSDLTYHYPEGGRGIEKVDITLTRGSFTVITGRIGAGKSTLLRTLLGLLPASAGARFWNGQEIRDPATFFIPPRVAYTAQIPHLFSETLKDNILLGLPEERFHVLEAIQLADLEPDLATMHEGVETLVGSRGVRLSGGQQQRVAAARMFVRTPELLVCDDLSSALDVETEQKLWRRIFSQEQVTCLAVSHRPAVLRRADQIIVMKDGKIAGRGALEHLLETCEEMRLLWLDDAGDLDAASADTSGCIHTSLTSDDIS
jgi:ATP-binding cassette, subfamily B, bacterial